MHPIKEAFDDCFSHWDIELPPEHLANRAEGELQQAGWTIRYRFGEEDGQPYLDFYADHRMTNARLERIHSDGRIEMLDAIQEVYTHDSDKPGDRERALRKLRQHNRAFQDRLHELGLDRRPTVD